MEINKLANQVNNQINSSKAGNTERTSDAGSVKKTDDFADKVSISTTSTNKSEELFAKIELEKLKQSSFDKLKEMKVKIQEFEAASKSSDTSVNDTELGKKLNDPAVWGKIADGILDK